ncbi:MAG: helix-turn-helix transcriptional regulator [Acetobacteraceae bacterium]|jgi:transcriptional regulator with XRE-family HTH domain
MLRGEFWPQVAECHPVRGEHGPAEPPWQRAILLPWLAELTYKGGMSDPVQIGERIRAARQERGWTQEQLAEAVGVSRSAVAQWETGRAGQLTGNLSRIAEVLSVGIEHLTHGREKRANMQAGTGDELALLRLYRECAPEDRQLLLRTARRLAKR